MIVEVEKLEDPRGVTAGNLGWGNEMNEESLISEAVKLF
jgi:hypothetical protein